MSKKISTWLLAGAAVLAVGAPSVELAYGAGPTYRVPCKKHEHRDHKTGKCKKNFKKVGKGKFKNTSGNDRNGHTFKVIHKNGQTCHKYKHKTVCF